MKILGIDPGLRTTGFGVLTEVNGKLRYIASGTIKTEIGTLPERLKTIFLGIKEVVTTYRPDCAAIEKVFVNVNPQSTLLLGQARGAAISALVYANLAVAEYTALQLKKAVVGYGKANKNQVQEMVQRLLDLPGIPSQDAADALGVAICHAHSAQALIKLGNLSQTNPLSGMRIKRGRLIG